MRVSVECDFQRDLRALLAAKLSSQNFSVDAHASTEALLRNWLKIHHRRIEQHARRVEWSADLVGREPSLPEFQRAALRRIEAAVHAGDDLNPYLSRQLANDKAFTTNDGMLNELGMQHMHMGEGLNADGLINGTKELLFVLVSDDTVRFVEIFDHDAFADERPFRIAQANWPQLFARWQVPTPRSPGQALTPAERRTLRKKGGNAVLNARDGSSFLPPGGGSAGSGISPLVVSAADRILDRVDAQERWCQDHGDELAERIEAAGQPRPTSIRLRLFGFEESGAMIVLDDEHGVRFRFEA
jgi:hypothetical protein